MKLFFDRLNTLTLIWTLVLITAGCASLPFAGRIHSEVPYTVLADNIEKPEGIAIHSDGKIYLTSTADNGSLIRITPGNKYEVLVRGLISPDAMVFDRDANLYISIELSTGSLLRLTPEGNVSIVSTDLSEPEGLAFDPEGTLTLAEDKENGRILKWRSGRWIEFSAGLARPENIAYDPAGNLYVTETSADRITRINPRGDKTPFLEGRLRRPDGIAYCSAYDGLFSVEDQMRSKLVFIDLAGNESVLATGLKFPQGLTCDSTGNLYVVEKERNRLLLFRGEDLGRQLPQVSSSSVITGKITSP